LVFGTRLKVYLEEKNPKGKVMMNKISGNDRNFEKLQHRGIT
jgi:hypothetical protein